MQASATIANPNRPETVMDEISATTGPLQVALTVAMAGSGASLERAMTLRRALLLLPPLLVGVWLALRWSALPDRLATSFDFAGRPQDETGRAAFAALALGMSCVVALVFGGLGAWIARVPAAWVNLPDKDFWLAPERRAATVARLATFLEVVGLALLAMLATLFVVIGETAIAGRAELPGAWLAAPAALVAVTVAMLVWLDAPFRERRRALRRRSLRAGG